MVFTQVREGEWVQPVRRGYLIECCGCGLKHKLNFKLVKRGEGRLIQLQAFRVEWKKVKKSKTVVLIVTKTGKSWKEDDEEATFYHMNARSVKNGMARGMNVDSVMLDTPLDAQTYAREILPLFTFHRNKAKLK